MERKKIYMGTALPENETLQIRDSGHSIRKALIKLWKNKYPQLDFSLTGAMNLAVNNAAKSQKNIVSNVSK